MREADSAGPKRTYLALLVLLGILFVYDSLHVYRVVAFKAIPHDDYAPYLQYVATLGDSGRVLHSPRRERIGSVILSSPFLIAPRIELSGDTLIAEGTERYYLALALANAFYFYAACALMAWIVLTSISQAPSVTAFHRVVSFCLYCIICRQILHLEALDGVGFFLCALIVPLVHRRSLGLLAAFGALSIVFNEKATIVYAGVLISLACFDRAKLPFAVPSVVVLLIYLTYRGYFGDGAVWQVEVDVLGRIDAFIHSLITPRGLILNIVPTAIVFGTIFAVKGRFWMTACLLTAGLLFLAAIQADVGYNVGHILFYSMPIVLYGVYCEVDWETRPTDRDRPEAR